MANLTTLEELKKYKGSNASGMDDVLNILIPAASSMVEEVLGYSPITATYNTWHNGKNGQVLLLPNRPITAVAALSIDGRAIPASTAFQMAGFTFDEDGLYLRSYTFSRGLQNVNVQYTAGYASIATLPAAIRQATNELVWTKFESRSWLGYKSKSLAGEVVSFDTSDMSKSVMGYLNRYRRVTPV